MKTLLITILFVVFLALVAPVDAVVLPYFEDFEGAVGSEWSYTSTETTPIGNRGFLGQFYAEDSVVLTLNNLPSHTELTLSFDLFIIKTWDGISSGYVQPDEWDLSILGGDTLLHTTFANYVGIRRQSYPGTYPGGDYESRTGADELENSLGFIFEGTRKDSVYSFDGAESFTFSHSADSISLVFSGDIADINPNEESWGIDNVSVTPEPATLLLLGLGGLMLRKRRAK